MNFKTVIYLLGRLTLFCVACMTIPLCLSLFNNDTSLPAFMWSICLSIVVGLLFIKQGEFKAATLTLREGMATVTLAWLLISLLGALPYFLSGILDPVSAFFESVSGFTTTGATTIDDIEILPHSILLWRSLTHWIGGIGIIVLFIAMLPQMGGSAVHLFNAEVSGPTSERVVPRIKNTAFSLCMIYITFTVTETLLLMFCGLNLFDALTHSLSTIATGGYSTYNTSVAHFNNIYIESIIAFFMILSGGNFALYYITYKKGLKKLWRDTEFKTYIGIITVITIAISINLYVDNLFNAFESVRHALFQVASIISTTGFVSNDFEAWPSFSKLCILLLMFIGGCAGSTAGGLKVSRIVLLLKLVGQELKRTIHPKMVLNIKINNKSVAAPVIGGITRFFFIYMTLFFFLTILISTTGLGMIDSIAVIAATISSVGPAFGVAGATCTYSSITAFGKIIICIAMLLGRLEIFTLLVLLRPEFWRTSRRW